MLSLHYALTKDDYINFYTYVAWDAPANKRKRTAYYIRQVIPLAIFLLAFYYTGVFDRPGKFILVIGFLLLIITLLSFINVRSNTMRVAERIADDPGNSSLFLENDVLVSETGIVVKDELRELRCRWEAIVKKAESKNYYFLFHNAVQAIIIPKRVFRTADEQMQFERLLTQYLSFEADVLAS